ncbi:MAG: tetratricopeptide repeat protein [Moraxellaceae bacterium]
MKSAKLCDLTVDAVSRDMMSRRALQGLNVNTLAVREFILVITLVALAGNAGAVSLFEKTTADQGISAFKSGDYNYARTWLSTKAAADDPRAWYYLGRMYQEGLGGFEVDLTRAERLYHQSAEKGVVEAMLSLADLYSRGGGVRPNFGVARIWHEKAARAGNVDAMVLLAKDFTGANGLPPNYDQARIWFEQAASAGNSEAMRALGDLYRSGQGVEVSMVEALMWYRLAVRAGNTDAQASNNLLSRILPADKQADAERRALEWEVLTGRAPAPKAEQKAADSKKTSDTHPADIRKVPAATAAVSQN